MKNIAIIAEYNPLHNGHIYQMRELHDSNIIVALSGNFTERGDVAMANKYSRARWAIENGASIVVEIPSFGVLSCAEHYARCASKVLSLLGQVDEISFGSESGDISPLISIANLSQDNMLSKHIQDEMAKGLSYPKAYANAIKKYSDIADIEDILSKPNNILGIEYIKALDGTNILPTTILRRGNDYNDRDISSNEYSSATSIREHIHDDNVDKYLPKNVLSYIRNVNINNDAILSMLYQKLVIDDEDISHILNISEGIDNRIREAVSKSNSYEKLLNNIKTKRYTMSRIKRALLDIVLGIDKDMAKMIDGIDYVTVLAIRESSLPMLSKINANIITRYNDYTKSSSPLASLDIKASKLYNLLSTDKIDSYQMQIIK